MLDEPDMLGTKQQSTCQAKNLAKYNSIVLNNNYTQFGTVKIFLGLPIINQKCFEFR